MTHLAGEPDNISLQGRRGAVVVVCGELVGF